MKEHFTTVKEIATEHFDEENKIGGLNANFSEYFNLKRIAAHYFKIPSNYRTSKPHAESLEEEFVYVISGKIDLWLNGRIKTMTKGDSIGFPPGTGVGHTFINNYEDDAQLFVSGERTKPDNQYRFHLEPHLEKECGKHWWANIPEQKLGGHNGLPGSFDSSFYDNDIQIFNGLDNIPNSSYSYPGDDETFTNGVCLSEEFKLKRTVIWLERMPVGKRSSWPHAHAMEEEFVYVLEGNPTVWLNGQKTKNSPETGVDFKAGSGVAHTLINETDKEVFYLCVGESETENDKIFYPEHPERNEQMRKEGSLWDDRP